MISGTGPEVTEGGELGHLTSLGGKVNPLEEFAITTTFEPFR